MSRSIGPGLVAAASGLDTQSYTAWLVCGAIAGFSGAIGERMQRSHTAQRILNRVAGTVFVLLGTRWQKDLRRRLGMEAVVAHQPVLRAVVGEAHVALGALHRGAAHLADEEGAVAAAVEEEETLLARGEVGLKLGD